MKVIIVLVLICRLAYSHSYNKTKMICGSESFIEQLCKNNSYKNTDLSSTLWTLGSVKNQNITAHILVLEGIPNAINRTFNASLECNQTSTDYGTFILSWNVLPNVTHEVSLEKNYLFFNVNQNDVVIVYFETLMSRIDAVYKLINTFAKLIFKAEDIWILELCIFIGNSSTMAQFLFTNNQRLIEPIEILNPEAPYPLELDRYTVNLKTNSGNNTSISAILAIARKERDSEIRDPYLYKIKLIAFGMVVVFSSFILLINLFKIYRCNQVAPA